MPVQFRWVMKYPDQGFSWFISFCFRVVPPGAENWPGWLFFLITLWHGIMRGIGFIAIVEAAALIALGFFAAFASFSYEKVWPYGIFWQVLRIICLNWVILLKSTSTSWKSS